MSSQPLLVRALRWNALFSGFSAIAMLAGAGWLAPHLGLDGPVAIVTVALFLLLFSAQLANIVRTGQVRRWEVRAIIAGDLAWVLGSIVLVALFYGSLSDIGLLLVDVVALAVLFFAIQQIRGLRAWPKSSA